jgi:two-component system phosphate regulon sensor histidine kinase PhoR
LTIVDFNQKSQACPSTDTLRWSEAEGSKIYKSGKEKFLMIPDKNIQAAAYELSPPLELPAGTEAKGFERPFSESLFVHNVSWFCQFRWLVIAVLLLFGVAGHFTRFVESFGIRPPGLWPFVTAAVLIVSNIAFLYLAKTRTSSSQIMSNLWGQITVDLVILSGVVYFVGSLETNIAFMYLFHIVLACVFFPRRHSLIVTIMAIGMFALCIIGEYVLKILPPMSIFTGSFQGPYVSPLLTMLVFNFFLTIGIWLVVWYLVSRLSSMVRNRDFELAETNRKLVAAYEERSRHMLTTTHQLKAPFAAIYSNTQLLLQGYCGKIPDEALRVIERISLRCRRLTTEIQEMLQLANLSSTSLESLPHTRMVSTELLVWCISQVDSIAQERGVVIKLKSQPVKMVGAEDHFKMLFVNLLTNAVVYSHKNGQVNVTCSRGPNLEAIVTIEDNGIGIPADKLPRIFEEHYRTKEAVLHNKESSGLGLAIVKQVAEMYGIHIRVESRPGLGTKFILKFPAIDENSENKEK